MQACIDEATTDAYNEYEQASGWLCCLEDAFRGILKVLFLGEPVRLKQLDVESDVAVVAVVQKGAKTARVSLGSISLINPSKEQSIWHRAYLEWSRTGG